MTTVYVSDPVHADVLTELREIAEVHLGYGPCLLYTSPSPRDRS